MYPIAIGYAVLIPAAASSIADLVGRPVAAPSTVLARRPPRLLALLVVVSVSTIVTLESGRLGSTTTPVAMPAAFTDVSKLLSADHQTGAVLWFGGPIYVTGSTGEQKDHSYTIASATHSLDVLNGQATSSVVQERDVLQYFCPTLTDPYCYVNPTLFPYLTRMVGALVVSPAGNDIGLLPPGITPGWLRRQLTTMFGQPRRSVTPPPSCSCGISRPRCRP